MSPHRYACHVRFSDVDVFGHVNNVTYFEYYQEARLAFLASLRRSDADLSLVVARMEVDYRRPILFRPEPYRVDSWVTHVGRSSFALSSQIRSDSAADDDALLSRAEAVMVAFDFEQQRARPLAEDEREALEAQIGR